MLVATPDGKLINGEQVFALQRRAHHDAAVAGGLSGEMGGLDRSQASVDRDLARRRARLQHVVHHMHDAVLVIDIIDGDVGGVALSSIRMTLVGPFMRASRTPPSTVRSLASPPPSPIAFSRAWESYFPGTTR